MGDTTPASVEDFARVLFLMAVVDDHFDTSHEAPVLQTLMADLGVPRERVSKLFFEAARGWDNLDERRRIVSRIHTGDEWELQRWLHRACEVMDADGIRHQQEVAFMSQIARRLKAGDRLTDILFPN